MRLFPASRQGSSNPCDYFPRVSRQGSSNPSDYFPRVGKGHLIHAIISRGGFLPAGNKGSSDPCDYFPPLQESSNPCDYVPPLPKGSSNPSDYFPAINSVQTFTRQFNPSDYCLEGSNLIQAIIALQFNPCDHCYNIIHLIISNTSLIFVSNLIQAIIAINGLLFNPSEYGLAI